MMHRLTTDCAKKYCNRNFTVQIIVENVVTCFFLRHSVRHIRDRQMGDGILRCGYLLPWAKHSCDVLLQDINDWSRQRSTINTPPLSQYTTGSTLVDSRWQSSYTNGWCVRNIITPATVCSQCCSSTCVLGEEFGPHNATTPGTSLAEDHGAYSVPFVCPCLPLFAR